MKKITILSLLVIGAIGLSQKANAQVSTDPVIVNIDLSAPVISIDLGTDPTVNFVYATAADYANSKTVNKVDHFTVVSNQAYNITVRAEEEFGVTAPDVLPLSVVTINVNSATLNGGTPAEATLGLSDSDLISNANPSVGATYNVDYTIVDASELVGLTSQIYTTNVIYTATQL